MIHAKVAVNVARGEVGWLVSHVVLSGKTNGLTGGKVCLGGLGVGGK